jgi:hypothetical protein
MFNLNWSDPDVRWLVITNWTLFAVTMACIGIVLYGVVLQLLKRRSERTDEHAMMVPELGLTMADGGERAETKNRK